MRGSPAVLASCFVTSAKALWSFCACVRDAGVRYLQGLLSAQLLLDRLGTGAFHIADADQVDPAVQGAPGDGDNNHEIIKIMFIFKDLVSYDPYTRFLAGTNSIVYDLFQEGLICYLLYF